MTQIDISTTPSSGSLRKLKIINLQFVFVMLPNNFYLLIFIIYLFIVTGKHGI